MYEMSRVSKSIETEGKKLLPGAVGMGEGWEWEIMGMRFLSE